jgi:tetratricopeptide (TPR) repeat protein
MLQDRGEPEAALMPIRQSIEEHAKAGRAKAARDGLLYFAAYSMALGDIAPALAFVRRQKVHGKELEIVSLLEAAAGREEESEKALQQFVAANPETPSGAIDWARGLSLTCAAISRNNGAAALKVMKQYPEPRLDFQARAQMVTHDYDNAEISFRRAIYRIRAIGMPLREHLAHFYLGQIYEATSRHEQAIREYQTFLSHYTNSHSRLPQITQARAALKRLGAMSTPVPGRDFHPQSTSTFRGARVMGMLQQSPTECDPDHRLGGNHSPC